ncbi:MAG: hypothetical protein AAF722_00190 [Cyanobacteria bacterium P01_C01_bin.70]
MARFLTRCYAAVTWLEALRLAALDQTQIASIRQAPNAELVHRTEWWAWWSDERLTTAIGLPESLCPESLSPDAVALISEVWESESPAPQCGWRTLATVQQVLQSEDLPTGREPESFSSRVSVTKLTVAFPNQRQNILYRYSQFLEESYLCDIRWN